MIQFKDVSKTFKSKGVTTQALQHVSLTIEDGDMFGVIGFSGAGKSTLLRMVNGLEMPTEGHVEINGQDLSKVSHNEMRKLRKSIGMVFQQFNLLDSRTVFDNVAIPLRLNKVDKDTMHKKVMELLEYVNLADKADAYPGQLSGGQKQRVGIARALATDPSILLCDEATSALDPETTESILQLLERIHKELNITMLIVTHEIQVIQRLCNRVAVMEHGKVVEKGSVLEVFSNPQQDMTKKFVRTVIPDQIPPSVVAKIHEEKDIIKSCGSVSLVITQQTISCIISTRHFPCRRIFSLHRSMNYKRRSSAFSFFRLSGMMRRLPRLSNTLMNNRFSGRRLNYDD